MVDPMSQTLTAWVAALSGITLALFGVDYYSLLYGMVGSMFAVYQAESMPRLRAMVFVVLCTIIGAALGNGALAFFGTSNKPLLLVVCIVGGYGAQALLGRLLKTALGRMPAGEQGDGGNKP